MGSVGQFSGPRTSIGKASSCLWPSSRFSSSPVSDISAPQNAPSRTSSSAMGVVIAAEGLGKKYILSHEQTERFTTLRDALASTGRRLAKAALHPFARRARPAKSTEDFWALREVSFEVRKGDRVGIIGRNGAGKSTLLKILSRITEPTAGRVRIHGRVASLLEVGTGFHPELTGRENVYLNAAIHNMRRREVTACLPSIIEFAHIGDYLDEPVKRYSSGMYLRLAFSIAAHLEPDILIVDEVLAVGDVQFQAKCLQRVRDISQTGRTVVLVSHDIVAVRNLC